MTEGLTVDIHPDCLSTNPSVVLCLTAVASRIPGCHGFYSEGGCAFVQDWLGQKLGALLHGCVLEKYSGNMFPQVSEKDLVKK